MMLVMMLGVPKFKLLILSITLDNIVQICYSVLYDKFFSWVLGMGLTETAPQSLIV